MSRDVTKLVPPLHWLAKALVLRCKDMDIDIKITDCYRTKEEQDALPSNVTTVKYPYSLHCYGLAFDICNNDTNNAYPTDAEWWDKVGKVGTRLGLEWGGSWKGFVDKPHFQLSTFGSSGKDVNKKVGMPSVFNGDWIWKLSLYRKGVVVKKNSSVSDIIWLQTLLNICGCKCTIDGKYGEETTEAFYTFRMMLDEKYCKAGSVTSTGTQLLMEKAKSILNV